MIVRSVKACFWAAAICYVFPFWVAWDNPHIAKTTGSRQALDLEALLEKTAAYCRKLEGAVFDFVCREEIREIIDPTLDVINPEDTMDDWFRIGSGTYQVLPAPVRKIINTYVYDYQCVRSGRAIHEVRRLLEENGKEKDVPNAVLKTAIVVFGTPLMAPVGLFAERVKPQYNYVVRDQQKVDGRRVFLIDVSPKRESPQTTNLYGKAWIDPENGDIIKIEWSDKRVGHYDIFEKRGARYMRSPQLRIRSEFKVEKNGIRFPSHLSVEEAYLSKTGRAYVRSVTEVTYKAFKFFTVEVEY